MKRSYYSHRTGTNPNMKGLPLDDVIGLYLRVHKQLRADGYFDEAFGFECVDLGEVPGSIRDVELEMLLTIRKKGLWPIEATNFVYSEADFFDVLEFLFQHVSKPVDGRHHSYMECGMHWETFNRADGQAEFRERVNSVLEQYERPFELSPNGEILLKPEAGFEAIFDADVPSKDPNVVKRIEAAILRYRRHGSTVDDRRQAVRDLADVLEYLRQNVKSFFSKSDEADLFNLANNFGIRHHNDSQKTGYDAALWLSWMFYFYLATIHVLLRKINIREDQGA